MIFTKNATEAVNLVAATWGRAHLSRGDAVLLTDMEHHANLVPWLMLAEERGLELRWIPMGDDYRLDLTDLDRLVDGVKLVACTTMSNVLGTIPPFARIAEAAHRAGALVLADGAQSVPHLVTDVRALGCDFLVFSAHKMLGPTGLGVLWGKEEVLNAMPPWQGGGSMIATVSPDEITWNRLPWKFEAGTPNIADAVAFAASLKYLKDLGWEALEAHEKALTERALERLKAVDGLTLYGPQTAKDRVGVFSFNLAGVDAGDAGAILDSLGLELRVGNLCAQPLMKHFACAGMIRASFYLYNTLEEVDLLVEGLKRAQKMLGKAPAKA